MPRDLWNDVEAQEQDDLEGLVYRSNLLGQDRSMMDVGGGTTSAKLTAIDHMGRSVEVLWIAGAGNALSRIVQQDCVGLRLSEILALMERSDSGEAELEDYLAHCVHALNRPQPPVETLLHAFLPARHVDHTHPDAIVSLANTENARDLCQELWGEQALWVDGVRPGLALSREVSESVRVNPRARLLVVRRQGLVTWGETSHECYERTIGAIQQAEDFIQSRRRAGCSFVASRVPPLPPEQRRQVLASVLPGLRGSLSTQRPVILQIDDSPEVRDYVGSEDASAHLGIGASCQEPVRSTRLQPLFVDWAPVEGASTLSTRLAQGIEGIAAPHAASASQSGHNQDPMQGPYPRVILIPGLGMITSGVDIQAADVTRRLCRQAIRVVEGCRVLGQHGLLSLEETCEAGLWPLALNNPILPSSEGDMAGRVAVVTGGACGIGRATARRLAQDGAHVAIFDIDLEGAQRVADEINGRHGIGRSMALHCDVADEAAVMRAYAQVILGYGGVDVVVSNAGISTMAPIDETTLDMWNRLIDVLATGYFLVSREAFRIWKAQGMGGCLIYVSSKNAVFAGKNTASYSAAKAAELHMARCLAEEGGAWGIRVNSVLPYAVMEGTSLWGGGLREARAASYGIKPEDLDEYYRQQTTLKVSVYPENVAEAIRFLASSQASRTTGGILTVDGGVGAYVR